MSYFLRRLLAVVVVCVVLAFGARVVGALLPEAAQLAYSVRNTDYTATVYVVDLARGLTTPLIDGVFDRAISFAPDGQLVFSRYAEDQRNIIFSNGDAGEIQLSPDAARDEYPVWSPDGAQVAFMSLEDEPSRLILYAMNSDGSERRNLSQSMEPHSNAYPIWLPDSTRIMYATLGVGQNSTFIVNSRTGELINFTYNTGIRSLPAWSPDGAHIAYVLYSALRSGIFVAEVNASGSIIHGTTVDLTDSNRAFNDNPRWSPDGTRIAYESANSGNPEIFVIAPDGSGALNLTQNHAVDRYPVWSHDGTQIAFISDRDGGVQIYVMNADGTNQRRVSYYNEASGYISSPTWLP